MYQTDPPRPPKEILPTMYDLKSEDPSEPGLPDEFHDLQPELLRRTFQPANYSPDEIFLAIEQERQRAANLAEYLRSLGIDPNNLPN